MCDIERFMIDSGHDNNNNDDDDNFSNKSNNVANARNK